MLPAKTIKSCIPSNTDANIVEKIMLANAGDSINDIDDVGYLLDVFSSRRYDDDRIYRILICLRYNLTIKQAEIYSYIELSQDQIVQVCEGVRDGLSSEQIALYADKRFNPNLMEEIRLGLEHGISISYMKQIIDPRLDDWAMFDIWNGLSTNKMNIEQARLYANVQFDYWQRRVIYDGFINGLTMEQIGSYANPRYSYEKMRDIYNSITGER